MPSTVCLPKRITEAAARAANPEFYGLYAEVARSLNRTRGHVRLVAIGAVTSRRVTEALGLAVLEWERKLRLRLGKVGMRAALGRKNGGGRRG